MKIPKSARLNAKRLFRACLRDGQLDESRVRQSVQQLIAQKPRGWFPTLAHLRRLVKLELDRRTARIESAAPLPPELQQDVATRLERLYGAGLTMLFAANPALIGGMRVQVGSDVYDGSVAARLRALAESFERG
ncbi:MAG: F0F1 ATP synthase subunit delta [Verrucomicrobiae bacterium]|nr:F0F1 ATP synthase subunit delta [Verrucomicrobiae bacterium]MDW8309568.1 F0F1 ATP synthase subunit delta [Verrucomicrobiales bacterium]